MLNIELPKLFPWQSDVVELLTSTSWYHSANQYAVLSPRQRGKSFLLCCLLLYAGIQHIGTIMMVEPTNAQANRMLRMVKSGIEGTPVCKSINESKGYIQLSNGSLIYFKSAEQKEGLRGFTTTVMLLIDEAAYINDDVIQDVIQTTNVNKAPVIMFSTPVFAQGAFYDLYTRGKDPSDKMCHTADWSYSSKYDFSPVISPEQIELYRRTYSAKKFQSEVEGKFITDKSMVFGDFTPRMHALDSIKDLNPVVCGIDWGVGKKNDSTALSFLNKSGQQVKIWATNDMDPSVQILTIAEILNTYPDLRCVQVETNSIGEVYMSTLRSFMKNKHILKGFNTSNTSKRTIIEQVITGFNTGALNILDDPDQAKQLSFYTIQPLSNGNYTYNNLNPSIHDDKVISLALAYDAYIKYYTTSTKSKVSFI